MDRNLDLAREELEAASEEAGGLVMRQLDSIDEGIFEEEGGERTRDEPGPKVDRVAELSEKLQGLEREAEGPVAERIATAREYVQAYLKDRPHGG